MRKEEINTCNTIAQELKQTIAEAEENDIFAKDDDGAYTDNVMVFLSKLEHIEHLMEAAYNKEVLEWKEYGE